MKKSKVSPAPTAGILTARELLGALGEHITNLRPSVNPKPKKKQISAAGMTARAVNSTMSVVRTSLQASKMAGSNPRLNFLELEESRK